MHDFEEIQKATKKIKELVRERFPRKPYFIDITLWNDLDFRVKCRHTEGYYSDKYITVHEFIYHQSKSENTITYRQRIIDAEPIPARVINEETIPC